MTGLIGVILFRFRGKDGDPDPPKDFGNHHYEIGWTIAPIVIVAALFVLTIRGMAATNPPVADGREPDVIVIGHQWWWEIRYPKSGAITANEVHVPAGVRSLVRLEAADVIHDFWVPQLGPKMDAVPGRANHLWIEPAQAGTYDGACAEYCGNAHAWMRIRVLAEEPAAFAAWEKQRLRATARPKDRTFRDLACVSCHRAPGQPEKVDLAPDLNGLAERGTLGAGVLPNSRENLARWLRDPQAIKPGCNMPNFQLTQDQIEDLVTYLWSPR